MSDARDLLEVVDRRIARGIPPRTLGRVVGVVQSVIPSLRVVQVLIDAATTPVSAAYPALPVVPVIGDSVAIERSRDGWLMVSHVLGRDGETTPVATASEEGYVLTVGSDLEPEWTAPPTPTGAIMAYGGAAAPTGWLLCDGSAVSRTTYADLFAAVGTAFGAGDASTTFNVPDLRGRFPLGQATAGTGSTLGGTGGAIDHTHTGPGHTHALSGTTATQNATDAADALTQVPSTGALSASKPAHHHDAGTLAGAASGTGATSSANAPFQAVTYIIRA